MKSNAKSKPLAVASAAILLAGGSLLTFAGPAQAAGATRTWVSGVGDDANPCSRTAPCKTFAGAISKTADGGTINAIDSAGYGSVTITKPITIDVTGVNGSVLVSGSNGITINAPDDQVVLRGLDIRGSAPCPGVGTALAGVKILAAASVHIEETRIQNTSNPGIAVATSSGNMDLFVENSTIRFGCDAGVSLAPVGGATVKAMISNTSITNASVGVHATAGAAAWLANDRIFNNTIGLRTFTTGTIDYSGSNYISGNGTDVVTAIQQVGGAVPSLLRVRRTADLPGTTDRGQPITWSSLTPRLCKTVGAKVVAKRRPGKCRIQALSPATAELLLLDSVFDIRIKR